MSKTENPSDLIVLNEMCRNNLNIQAAPLSTNCIGLNIRGEKGTVEIGVPPEVVVGIQNNKFVGALYVADKEQFYKTQRGVMAQPKIICLCGSLRFKKLFAKKELQFVLQGKIVLTPCCMYVDAERTDSFMEHKEQFDFMHFRKIDLCDLVYVINEEGYIGESTTNEINYAKSIGKPIEYYYR